MVPNFLSNSDYDNSIQHLNGKEAKKMFTCPEKNQKSMGYFSESTCTKCLENTDVHFIVNSKNMYQLSKIPSTCKKWTFWQIC